MIATAALPILPPCLFLVACGIGRNAFQWGLKGLLNKGLQTIMVQHFPAPIPQNPDVQADLADRPRVVVDAPNVARYFATAAEWNGTRRSPASRDVDTCPKKAPKRTDLKMV